MKTLRGAAALLLFLLCVSLASAQSTTPNHTVTFNANEKVEFSIAPVNAAGEAAGLDAAPVVVSSDESVATVSIAWGDPYRYFITGVAPGTAVITVSAASFGKNVSEQISVTVKDATAANLGITFKPPVKK